MHVEDHLYLFSIPISMELGRMKYQGTFIVTKELGNKSLLMYGMTKNLHHENLAELVIAKA